MWNSQTRLHYDPCTVAVDTSQAQQSGMYKAGTPGYRWCESDQNYQATLTEPMHWQKQYFSACRVDNDTDLSRAPLTDQRYINQLFTRPYAGTGYQGAGSNTWNHKNTESRLIMGEDTRGGPRRACDVLAGVSINAHPWQSLPEFGNPQREQHIIEPWTRGGEPTRDYVRRVNYNKRLANQQTSLYVNRAGNANNQPNGRPHI